MSNGGSPDVVHRVRFVPALVVIVGGALLLADSVIGNLSGSTSIFEGTNHGFEATVGIVTLVVGASTIPSKRLRGAAAA